VPPVVVRAQPHLISNSGGPYHTISQSDIKIAGNSNFTQILQNNGGLQLLNITGNNSRTGISMRGFGANATSNTLLLLNGVPITNPDLAPPDLNAIPIEDIEQVEIIAGSESVLYGDQAVGGVVNVITQSQPTPTSSISCNTGSYRQRYCVANMSHDIPHGQANLRLARFSSDNYRAHSQNEQNNLFGQIYIGHARGNDRFYYRLEKENMLYPGALTRTQVRQNRRQASNSTDFFTNWNGILHFQDIHRINHLWQTQIDIVRRQMSGNGVLGSRFTQTRTTNYLKPQLKSILLEKSKLTTGTELQVDQYRLNSLYGLTNEAQQKVSLFFLIDHPFNSQWQTTAGARAAQLQSNLTNTTTKDTNVNRALATTIGLQRIITTFSTFYLRRAESFRFPKADENAASNNQNGLRTQRGVAYETGIHYDKATYSAELDLYQLNLRDEIAFDPFQTAETPFGSNRNLAPTLRRGLNLSTKWRINNRLQLGAQYHYVNARFQSGVNSGNRIPLVAENMAQLSADYSIKEDFHLFLESVYTGNQYAANDDANMAGKIGGYMLHHLHLNYTQRNLTASLRINNLFNRYYYFYVVTQPGAPDEYFYPAPTRNCIFTVSYQFS
jgi:iron complex outermembrane receptor protein